MKFKQNPFYVLKIKSLETKNMTNIPNCQGGARADTVIETKHRDSMQIFSIPSA